MNYFHTNLFASLACFSFAIIPLTAKKPDRAVESIDGSVYEVGMYPKDLYKKLGFKAGLSKDEFVPFEENIKTSDITFEMVPVKGGIFSMGSSAEDKSRSEDELLARKVKVSDFWMGKHELTWDEYELWIINLDKDNRDYKKLENTEQYELSDAVTKPTAPYTDMSFGMGKRGYPAICMTQL